MDSAAIVRHIGRRYALYGETRADAARVDQAIGGWGNLATKLAVLDRSDAAAVEAFWAKHADPASDEGTNGARRGARGCRPAVQRSASSTPTSAHTTSHPTPQPPAGGAHLAYVDRALRLSGGAFFLGDRLSIADVVVADGLEPWLELWGRDKLAAQWPAVAAHRDAVLAAPGIAAYMSSPQRLAKRLP